MKDETPVLSVVVPSWNTRELLARALETLDAARRPSTEVIVVDNASADGSADMIAERFPEVRLVRNERNEGFAIGCNQGMRLARGEFVLLLNADTEVAVDAVERMLEFLRRHPAYGCVAPRLVHPDGRTQPTLMRFPNLSTPLWFGTPLERWFPGNREVTRYFLRDRSQEEDMDVDQPPAACWLLRRRVLDEVGLFDERLWLFFNDVDLSLRMHRAGWRTRYLADALVVHHVGASTSQFGSFLSEWHANRLVYYRKHHGRLAGVWVKACVGLTFSDYVARQIRERLRGRPSEPLGPMWRDFRALLAR